MEETKFQTIKLAVTESGSLSSKAETRRQNENLILQSAERVFAKYGYKGASTKDIAKEAGLPKANIHYYFKTKERLYARVLENMLLDWMKAAQMFKSHDDPAVTLSKYISAKMDLARQRPHGSKLWAKEIMSGAPVVKKELSTTLKTWVDECVFIINRWIAEKKITPVDPKALLYMIWATTQHYADFNSQIVALNDNKELTDEEFESKKQQVIKLILTSLGLGTNKQ